jgi:hypothetical protein
MVEVDKYRQIVQDFLTKVHPFGSSPYDQGVESQLVFATQHDHYLLVDVGWNQKTYVYGAIIHLDIKDGKVWIQRNMTEINLAEQLVEMGIPREQIVIGSPSPFMRQFSNYAVG